MLRGGVVIVGMLFPNRERCGIAIFTRDVVAALENAGLTVMAIDTDASIASVLDKVKKCDIVHVQYEAGFFLQGRFSH